MTSERDCTETRENVSTSATSEVAAQAWDKSNWRGNSKCHEDNDQTHVDMGDNDIYNTNRGNHELGAGNSGVQTAENTINRTVDQLMDGNYDTNKIIKQLQGTDKDLSKATGDYKDAIKHLGASSTTEDLDDMVDGRRDVMGADGKVGKAIEQLKKGDEAGAIKSLLQSLGKIDKAQGEFADAETCEDPRSDQRGDQHGDQHHGNRRVRDEDAVNDREGNRLSFSPDGQRMHNHMYRDFDGGMTYGENYSVKDRGDFFNTNYRNGLGSKDYGRTDSGMWGSGDNGDTQSFQVPNPFGGTDTIEWNSDDLSVSKIRVNGPFGGSATIDVDELNRFGDKVSKVVDPLGVFPTPSELSSPKKLVKKVLDPFHLF